MQHYYDINGRSLNMLQWATLMGDEEYKRVAYSKFSNGYWVSTVWLGIDHSFGFDGGPVIFETMVFGAGDDTPDCRRWRTREEAVAGHHEMVEKWKEILNSELTEAMTEFSRKLDLGE